MPNYKTKEEYWRAQGRYALAVVVRRQTIEELHKKGIKANPESAVYKKTFNRLAAKYQHDQASMMKDRKKQNDAWVKAHADDTDEQLIAYLRSVVTDPEKFKKAGSVPGGYFLTRRFGGWYKALRLAGLIPPETQTPPEEQALSPPQEQ